MYLYLHHSSQYNNQWWLTNSRKHQTWKRDQSQLQNAVQALYHTVCVKVLLNGVLSPSYRTAIGLGDSFFVFLLERITRKEVFVLG